MQPEIKMGKEIIITTPDEIGLLSRISTAIAEAKINITAMCAYDMEGKAHLRIITDNNKKAIEIISKSGFKAYEHDVLMCEVSPHILHPETSQLVGNYDVDNYWCASEHGSKHALLVFSPASSLVGARLK